MAAAVAFIPYVMAAISVMQGVSSLQSGRQNALNAEAEGKQAKLNAAAEANRQRRINLAREAELQASAGAQGSTFEGSPMEAYISLVTQGELQAQDKLFEGKLINRQKRFEAEQYRREGQSDLLGGLFSAAGSMFGAFGGGASNLAGMGGTSTFAPGAYGTATAGSSVASISPFPR